jgi:hypothetical protein
MANTIYEDYTKIDDKIWMFRNGKYNWEPLVKQIVLSGYTDFDLFIIKSNSGYMLCEGLTGCVILHQKDLVSRILRRLPLNKFYKALPGLLDQRGGAGMINQLIVNFIFDHDQVVSPRYKANEDRL